MQINPAVTDGLGQLKWINLKATNEKLAPRMEMNGQREFQLLDLRQCFRQCQRVVKVQAI